MLYWVAMFFGKNLGNKNRIEQYVETKKTKLSKEVLDKRSIQDLARADDDGFAIAKSFDKLRTSREGIPSEVEGQSPEEANGSTTNTTDIVNNKEACRFP